MRTRDGLFRATALSLAFPFLLLGWAPGICAESDGGVEVELAVDPEVEQLEDWGEQAAQLIREWHPRLVNLLPSEGFAPPQKVFLRIKHSAEGVGATSGNRISISSGWIEKHPEDFGLVIHELVHVVQRYPRGKPMWVTEGIADYLRWAIYEGKSAERFPRPKATRGYEKGYQVMGGFLLWLETGRNPGIVGTLNAAMREGTYEAKLFTTEDGRTLDDWWAEYVGLSTKGVKAG